MHTECEEHCKRMSRTRFAKEHVAQIAMGTRMHHVYEPVGPTPQPLYFCFFQVSVGFCTNRMERLWLCALNYAPQPCCLASSLGRTASSHETHAKTSLCARWGQRGPVSLGADLASPVAARAADKAVRALGPAVLLSLLFLGVRLWR